MKKGTKFTDEHREKISNSLKGRKLTEEHRKNMSEAKKGKPSNCAKSVKIIYLNKEYNFLSMTAAEKFFQETFGIKIFYWFRRTLPKKYAHQVQLVQVGDVIKHKIETLQNVG